METRGRSPPPKIGPPPRPASSPPSSRAPPAPSNDAYTQSRGITPISYVGSPQPPQDPALESRQIIREPYVRQYGTATPAVPATTPKLEDTDTLGDQIDRNNRRSLTPTPKRRFWHRNEFQNPSDCSDSGSDSDYDTPSSPERRGMDKFLKDPQIHATPASKVRRRNKRRDRFHTPEPRSPHRNSPPPLASSLRELAANLGSRQPPCPPSSMNANEVNFEDEAQALARVGFTMDQNFLGRILASPTGFT